MWNGPAIFRHVYALLLGVAVCCLGCGTTRSTDTSRTATEQLLISDSIDRTVQQINFRPLAGRRIYLDTTYLSSVTDQSYLVSTLRQHMLASGCILSSSRDEAEYIVEARAGAVGTNRHDLLFGIPAVNIPTYLPGLGGAPASIPEMPIIKRSHGIGVSKIAVYAYHRETGAPIWQSGIAIDRSTARDTWILGAGPFQSGTIRDGTAFAGTELRIPLLPESSDRDKTVPVVNIHEEAVFQAPVAPVTAQASYEDQSEQTPQKQ